jgi:hypothetical protein
MSFGEYYFLGIFDAIFYIILSIGIFGLNFALLAIFRKSEFKTLTRWSKNINSIYCIHWLIIPITVIFLAGFGLDDSMDLWLSTILAAVIMILSDIIAVFYHKRKAIILQ